MPMHLRWELYPVAHEPGNKAKYGGSYLEESDWWKKPREVSMVGELRVMVPEILFLVALWEHNRKMWVRSFPFHFGIYMVIGATVMMMGSALLGLAVPDLMAGGLGTFLHNTVLFCGAGGLGLSIFGALGLLQRRLTDPGLRDFTTVADIFNLVFFIVAFGLALVHFIAIDSDLSRSAGFLAGIVTFSPVALTGSVHEVSFTSATIILMGVLVAYIPLTHMSHFIGKYFAYHAIRWNDKPNLKGGDEEAAIGEMLTQPVSWAAKHIGADGKKTWADLATQEYKK